MGDFYRELIDVARFEDFVFKIYTNQRVFDVYEAKNSHDVKDVSCPVIFSCSLSQSLNVFCISWIELARLPCHCEMYKRAKS